MDTLKPSLLRWTVPALLLFTASCQDALTPTAVPEAAEAPGSLTSQEMRGQSPEVVSEMMALPATVFGQFDQASGRFVFGVEHMGVARGIQTAMERRGVPASSFEVRVTEPIYFASTLRSVHRPTLGGIQIHFSNFLCTLGFNVNHGGVASFITNSHCTDQQGTTDGTVYYQPTSSAAPNSIGTEVHDPGYFRGGRCSRGKQCRYSDAARVAYASGIDAVAQIAKTEGGVNSGDLNLNTSGNFTVGSQDNSTQFSGTVNKVGRTTGWTDGDVVATCTTVNVSGTNIQLLCQTLVENPGETIVGGGDSGSPVFKGTGSSVTLVGILWGGSSNGELFVFSPLKNIQDELGTMTADFTGTLTGGGDGDGGDDGGDDGSDEPNCPPNSNAPKCRG